MPLIENFLLRDVLRPNDDIVMHPGVYFETQHQVRSLKFLNVTQAGARLFAECGLRSSSISRVSCSSTH